MDELVQEYKKLKHEIPSRINNSCYKPIFFIKLLGLNNSTYYRKLRENDFSMEEVELITKVIYQDETMLGLLNKSENDYREGRTFTTSEAMAYLRKQHL